MARPRKNNISLTDEDRTKLRSIANATSEEQRRVQRAKIILLCDEGLSNTEIANRLNINRITVGNILEKCVALGPEGALDDCVRSGRPAAIDDGCKAYVKHIACYKPTEFGYPQELWTYSKLADHIRANCVEDKYPELRNITKSMVWEILEEDGIKPHRISYYLEKRDPEFKEKMEKLLIIYKEIQMQVDSGCKPDMPTVSFDEKPGIQILENTAPDLMPRDGHPTVGRDYEYRRHGTLTLLAGLNLNDGTVIPLVRRSHTSDDFIDFLDILDERYSDYDQIRIILDNHSAHLSKKVSAYLASKPNRFVFVFTPKHGSWLNLVESFFGKMARVMLRGIRASSYEELEHRIYQYIEEVNAEPVVYRWTYKMDEIEV